MRSYFKMGNQVIDHTHFSGLKMCGGIFDLFPFIFDYGNVGHGMWVLGTIDACGNEI